MKDRTVKGSAVGSGIPVLSPLLHIGAMPFLVFLRFNFGYDFLLPKSIFLPVIFTGAVLSWIAVQPPASYDYLPLVVFHLSASALYLLHLALAVAAQTSRSAKHDQYSGTSLLSIFVSERNRESGAWWIHLFAEPLLIAAASLLLPQALRPLLLLGSLVYALKEWVNAWLTVRSKKRDQDSVSDAYERGDEAVREAPPLLAVGRIVEAPKKRNSK